VGWGRPWGGHRRQADAPVGSCVPCDNHRGAPAAATAGAYRHCQPAAQTGRLSKIASRDSRSSCESAPRPTAAGTPNGHSAGDRGRHIRNLGGSEGFAGSPAGHGIGAWHGAAEPRARSHVRNAGCAGAEQSSAGQRPPGACANAGYAGAQQSSTGQRRPSDCANAGYAGAKQSSTGQRPAGACANAGNRCGGAAAAAGGGSPSGYVWDAGGSPLRCGPLGQATGRCAAVADSRERRIQTRPRPSRRGTRRTNRQQ
jgi:hypothetical protein